MKTRLTVEPLPQNRHQEFIEFIYREFFPREPLALASGLADKTNAKTVETFTEWLLHGVSLVVIDPESDQIVAGALNCLVKKTETFFDKDYSCLEKEDRCIWKLIDHLEIGYDVFDQFHVDCGMELVFLCVKESHTKQGLARQLTEETIALAHRLGMPFIKSNPSTPITIHIFESLGFETISEMKLVDFLLDGKPVFFNAKPEDVTRLCVKKIGK